MYTQCPKCLTYFQVTTEHLKVAQGNVRCGQCSNVFSALGNLSEAPPQQGDKKSAEQTTPPSQDDIENGSSAQSKLTNAIAAIQALNQSSQKILSQGRKSYVNQLQKQAKVKREYTGIEGNSSTARNLAQDDPETDAINLSQSEESNLQNTNIDIEQALAAVDGIVVEEQAPPEDTSPFKTGESGDEDITPAFDGSHLVEDYKGEHTSPDKEEPAKRTRAKILKAEDSGSNDSNTDDDVFDFSELDLPETEELEFIESSPAKNKKTKKETTNKQNKTKKKQTAKQQAAKQTAKQSTKQVSKNKPSLKKTSKSRIKKASAAKTQAQTINIPQNIISDPEIIIENNIPTLAIPKQLLEDFQEEKTSSVHHRAMLTWGLSSLIMMLTFLGQTIYFKHNELGQISQLRPWVQMFCKHASCVLTMQMDVDQIELLGQDIRSHPKGKNALMVSATIINNASFTQPYPGLQLNFSDINGEKVATRNFLPKDYLSSKLSAKKGMESNIPIQLVLELVDPGKSAVNFEFDFFPL